MLLRQQQTETKTRYFLKNMYAQINSLHMLIGDLLDVSKMEAGKLDYTFTNINISTLIQKVIIDFQYTIETHTIQRIGESTSLIHGDAHRLEQVFINLISNAVKYSPEGDRVIVRITETRKEVVVRVQDFGIGIPRHDQKKIFERFFRSDKQKHTAIAGFGLGLYIVKEIIERHRGKISVQSQEGVGSTFTITLPTISRSNK